MANKTWDKASILLLLNNANNKTVLRFIKVVYDNQTEDEKLEGDTKHNNGMGFNGTDANFMTSLYENGMKYGKLTDKQTAMAKKVMQKYWRQMVEKANANEEAKAAQAA